MKHNFKSFFFVILAANSWEIFAADDYSHMYSCDLNIGARVGKLTDEGLKFQIRVIKSGDKEPQAFMLGNNGPTELLITDFSHKILRFQEKTPLGNIITTHINVETGQSVMSRNTFIIGRLAASQYIGTCTVDKDEVK